MNQSNSDILQEQPITSTYLDADAYNFWRSIWPEKMKENIENLLSFDLFQGMNYDDFFETESMNIREITAIDASAISENVQADLIADAAKTSSNIEVI